ncbi:hypothetical protein ACJRO7_027163 [Eucalyptus globulus]|uniref:Gnk2-homologous domain-containing protein n=1 Tax=Eucalyptus globulus TaxID=34317 RepID=A0ABD3JWD2_EUCGL
MNMKMQITAAVQILAFIVGFSLVFDVTKGDPDLTVVTQLCSTFYYPACDSLGANMIQVFYELEQNTPSQGYNYYYASPDADGAKCYGHATCNYELSEQDCYLCLSHAGNLMMNECFQVSALNLS